MQLDKTQAGDDEKTWGMPSTGPGAFPGLEQGPLETVMKTKTDSVDLPPGVEGPSDPDLAASTAGTGTGSTLPPGSTGGSGGGSFPGGTGEFESLPSVALEPGKDICDKKFHLIEKIGGGAMGDVWKVKHNELGRTSVLKVIKREIAANRTARKRFWREGQLMAKLDHPSAVRVFDLGFRDGLAYMEMELVKGQSLDKVLKEGKDSKPMSLEWTWQILEQLCDVLQVAHTFRDEEDDRLRPIVHRDLKPSNLMLVDGKPPGQNLKVLDFGIAKMTEATKLGNSEDASLATMGFVGTPAYSSPEQVNNDPVDGRSDLYAVGVFLYQLLTGSLPFKGGAMVVCMAHLHKDPPQMAEANPLVKVPPAVEAVVRRCLAKKPEDRPQSAQELARLFREAAGAGAGTGTGTGAWNATASTQAVQTVMTRDPAVKTTKGPNRKLVLAAAGGLAAVALIAGLAAFVGGKPKPDKTGNQGTGSTSVGTTISDPPPPPPPGTDAPSYKGYKTVRPSTPGGPWGLDRETDHVSFTEVKPGSRVFLPDGYEPEDSSLGDLVGTYPRSIVRRSDGVRFLRIPGKTFEQGDYRLLMTGEDGIAELTPHKVQVSSFYIQETEVTNAEMEAFFKKNPLLPSRRWKEAAEHLVKSNGADERTAL